MKFRIIASILLIVGLFVVVLLQPSVLGETTATPQASQPATAPAFTPLTIN